MRKSTIPFLVTSLFLAIALSSCASKIMQGYNPMPVEKAVYEVPYFSNSETDYVYKANITVYGNELGGIFIAKKINESTHRVVFTTEFGNKLLDFEVSENDFKVNSIVEELDKKILINTLRDDFRLLFRKQYQIKEQFENSSSKVYQSLDGKRYNYIFISKADGKLLKLLHTSKRKEKINLIFTSENNMFADKIIIEHKNIKLRIEFNQFKP